MYIIGFISQFLSVLNVIWDMIMKAIVWPGSFKKNHLRIH